MQKEFEQYTNLRNHSPSMFARKTGSLIARAGSFTQRPFSSFRFFWIVTALCALAVACKNEEPPIAKSGILDASSWNFAQKGKLILRGEWMFYWGTWKYSPQGKKEESHSKSGEILYVPSAWNGESRNGKGFGTYVLDVKLPQRPFKMGMILPDQSSSYELFLDGRHVLNSGKILRNQDGNLEAVEEGIQPLFFEFQPSGAELQIVLQIANEDLRLGGFWSPIVIGEAETLRSEWNRSLRLDSFLVGGLLIMAFLHLSFFIVRRKETPSLYFGLFCLIMGSRSLFPGNRLIMEYTDAINYENMIRIEYLTFYLSVPVFLNYILSLYPRDLKRVFVDVLWWISLVASSMVLFFPMRIFTHTIPMYYLNAFIAGSLGLYTLIRAVRKKREGSLILLTGFVFIYLAMINDLLYVSYFLETGYYSSIGTFVFLAAQSVSLSVRNSKNMQRLLDLSRNLERKVEERTQRLHAALRTIEEDLDMAVKIQTDFLEVPDDVVLKNTGVRLYSFYQPIAKVGGDFYIVRPIAEKKLRIFLADAIGHGVQASLMTMVIQSEYNSIFDPKLSPGEFLTKLSGRFSARIGDISPFFSGLIADLDFETDRILISSAGNPSCILSTNEKTLSLDLIGPYAGMIPGFKYEELSETLPKEFRLYLFTDGLPDRFIFSEGEYENFSMHRWLEQRCNQSIGSVCKELLDSANALRIPEFKKDDMTLLGIERSILR
ncbi:PP2C family protein-serine/threonine phosphatase [Leptospira yasudae]|uniref:Protein phosphatase n=1 Tax=Leptospira yasudae TaxID=2202201 RepID=A0A6N4QQZ2_9LEPT|nr:SpoIIE family protein phosphatase [Leptospira yasudae]TGL75192.1 protein phosphatase [Leptospira yasudae]TGL77832.1 protein phosphatase [Leptospira yasudae]TGL81239.1 protein phosphatase [Leptospira yasudae]